MFIPPFPYNAPPYAKLLEILGRQDPATQKALAELSERTAQRYCDRYADHSDLFRSYAYLYDLSKRVRWTVYRNIMFDYAPVEDFAEIQQIKEHYTKQFGELLDNPPWRCVNGDVVKPIPETLT